MPWAPELFSAPVLARVETQEWEWARGWTLNREVRPGAAPAAQPPADAARARAPRPLRPPPPLPLQAMPLVPLPIRLPARPAAPPPLRPVHPTAEDIR